MGEQGIRWKWRICVEDLKASDKMGISVPGKGTAKTSRILKVLYFSYVENGQKVAHMAVFLKNNFHRKNPAMP